MMHTGQDKVESYHKIQKENECVMILLTIG